jgi:hypothetical protein
VRLTALVAIVLAAAPAASAAATSSPSRCAVDWNRWAAPALRLAVARSDAAAAFIDARATVGTDRWSKSGGSSSTSSAGCSIEFVLPRNGGVLQTWGRWQAGSARTWHRLVRFGRAYPVPHNARVHRDGTIGFTG